MRRRAARARLAGVATALAGGLLAACLLELPALCGDGHVDADAGEDCDPAVAGTDLARCDPLTCKQQVVPAVCGDGKRDRGEACDGDDLGDNDCPTGTGYLGCTADCRLDETRCDPCGNGRVDPEFGEECDPNMPSSPQSALCADLIYPLKPYASGEVSWCDPDTCRWYRAPCGYCGDHEADLPKIIDPGEPTRLSIHEVCDGSDAQPEERDSYCRARCPGDAPLCTIGCSDDCQHIVDPPDLQCCARAGAPCPSPGDPLPCCAAHEAGLADLYSPAACENEYQMGAPIKLVCK